jgi:hypothetical protein
VSFSRLCCKNDSEGDKSALHGKDGTATSPYHGSNVHAAGWQSEAENNIVGADEIGSGNVGRNFLLCRVAGGYSDYAALSAVSRHAQVPLRWGRFNIANA